MAHIVLTEQDPHVLRLLRLVMEQAGHTVVHVPQRHHFVTLLQESVTPLVLIVTGTTLLGAELAGDATTEVILHSLFMHHAQPAAPAVRHTALMLSASADLLSGPVHEHLARARIPVLGKPFETAHLLSVVRSHAATLATGQGEGQSVVSAASAANRSLEATENDRSSR